MKVQVWTEYKWECSNCGRENEVSYSPEIGAKLPKCECGKRDECIGISEDCRPGE